MKRSLLIYRTLCAGLALLFILLICVSCDRNGGIPDGTYSCIEADTGEMYIFSGKKVQVKLYIMGNVTEDHSGTYRVKDGKITMSFPSDRYDIYNGTFDYALSEDGKTLTISGEEFARQDPAQ